MGAGTYAFMDTGVIGTDEIKVALIYKPAAVTPVGAYRYSRPQSTRVSSTRSTGRRLPKHSASNSTGASSRSWSTT